MEKEYMGNQKQNYLGIDWGYASVGIALAHMETGVALAYDTLDNTQGLLAKLGEIIAREEVGTVIIGIPARNAMPASNASRSTAGWRSAAGGPGYKTRGETEYEGERLGKSLEGTYHVAVVYQDEMFTSKMAQANLIERGEKHVGKHDDAEAARIILQSYMDRKQSAASN